MVAVVVVMFDEGFDLTPKYMAKHLQALKRAGLAISTPGPRGGYRLAKRPADISLWSIAEAIDGVRDRFLSFKASNLFRFTKFEHEAIRLAADGGVEDAE